MKKLYHLVILVISIQSSCTTRYYFVRHAEKACDDCFNCALKIPEGENRALALRDSLINKGIDTIFASQCLRTQLTAKPLAESIHKSIQTYQTDQLNTFIHHLKKFNDSRDVLIVGHSTQIPVMIDSLTHRTVTIGDSDFNKLFIVTKRKFLNTTIQLQISRYGNPNP